MLFFLTLLLDDLAHQEGEVRHGGRVACGMF